MAQPSDFCLRAGRVFCAVTGRDGPGWVAVAGGRIAAVGEGPPPAGGPVREFRDGVLLPGLSDFHAHPGLPESRFAIDADREILPTGVTTVLAQGEAGADNVEAFLARVVRESRARVRLALNVVRWGEAPPAGEADALAGLDVDACVAAARAAGPAVWGLSVNTSVASCGGADPREVLRRALVAAEAAGLPLLVGTRRAPDVPLAEQLALLRPGDVVTYCFHPGPEGLLAAGRVRSEVRRARARGVRFDVGHGRASFSFPVAEACLAQEFPPDTISSDLYRAHRGETPPHSLPLVLGKLIAAGLPEREALARVTCAPAALLRESDLGALRPGAPADLTVLEHTPGELTDCAGARRPGDLWRAVWTHTGAAGGGPGAEGG